MSKTFSSAIGALAGIIISIAFFSVLIPAFANFPAAREILARLQSTLIFGVVMGLILGIIAVVLFILSIKYR